jgi:4-phosphopantoate---beta-alanine ligase
VSVPDTHPRAKSLKLRERLVEGLHAGLVTESGLIAHGRGEALDYLLGERTHDFARRAIEAASAHLTLARHPVLSINGNAAALAAEQFVALAQDDPRLLLEVNLFYYTPERAEKIITRLRAVGSGPKVLDSRGAGSILLPGSDNPRRQVHPDGMGRADVVLVSLEDGDRCEALLAGGMTVICIDLNPLSRTAQRCQVSIVDELTRAVPLLRECLRQDRTRPRQELEERLGRYDNRGVLAEAVNALRTGTQSP